jgi:hypothetical protein
MTRILGFALSLLSAIAIGAHASPAVAETYKMTTPIAPGVETPDTLETSIGTLKLNGGVPTKETAAKLWDNLDRARAFAASIVLKHF